MKQGTQTNFTIPISVPNINCAWCTLQVRYHPNSEFFPRSLISEPSKVTNKKSTEPTEPIFHNCADIAITTPGATPVAGRLMGIAKPGPTYSALDDLSSFTIINPASGLTQRLSPTSYHIGLRDAMPAHKNFAPIEFLSQELFVVGNGLVAPLEGTDVYYFLSRPSASSLRGPFTQLSEFRISYFNYTAVPLQFPSGIDQWAGLISTHSKSTPAPLILIGQTTSNNIYSFSAFWLYTNGSISGPIGTTSSDSTFVNFFWTEFNPCAGSEGTVYILSGDENSLDTLDVTLYSIDVASGAVTAVLVNNTEFTVSSIHAWVGQDCQYLYTVSPGLVSTPASSRVWSLLRIEPTTGNIASSTPVTPPGLYNDYYGGGIYGNSITSDNQLLYLFQRSIDPSFDLYGINLQTGSVDFQTGVNLGVNGAYSLSSVMFTPE